ncbi:MAG: ABC transporter substrate-binding protein, partial [Candidatus Methanosuratincola sp.]
MRKSWLVVLLLVGVAVSLIASDGEPRYGGTLIIGMGTEIAKWDIHNCSGMQNLGIQRLVTELLVDSHWETGELIPWLAESWE